MHYDSYFRAMLAGPYFWAMLALGLCLGSFATALAYRLPRGTSMVTKARSACPACGHKLGFLDLIPVFSWLALRGKCRYCKAVISKRYPVIEVATLALCVLFYAAYGATPQTLTLFALSPVLTAIVAIDLRHKIIPDVLNFAVLALGAIALWLTRGDFIPHAEAAALYGAGALALRFACEKILKREPMGLGDVKFFAASGFWLGMDLSACALFLITAGASGVVLALGWKKIAHEDEFPFGPALAVALCVAILWLKPFLS